MPVSMPYEENGVRVNFPDTNYFRFSDCPAYQAISSKGVKEMDIGWFDIPGNTLWLVELKGFYHPTNPMHRPKNLADSNVVGKVMDELFWKSIHSICLISTNRAGTQSCMDQPVPDQAAVKIVHLVRTLPGQELFLSPMQDQLRAKLIPFIAIYNISAVVIVSYDTAVAGGLIPWVV